MKKVLALVLALTMVLGFASTAAAAYIQYDLFKDEDAITYTVDGLNYYDGFTVDGDEEYTVKIEFTGDNLNTYLGNSDSTYDTLYTEYQVLGVIESYTGANFYGTADWTATTTLDGDGNGTGTNANNIHSDTNDLWKEVYSIVGNTDGYTASTIYKELVDAVVDEGTFKEGYNSSSFKSAMTELERAWDTYYGNSYYGYAKGIAASVTANDPTYATITSQPTVSIDREVGGDTTYTVEFDVQFTNTTFKSVDTSLDVSLLSGSSTQNAIYEYENTLEFTVYQAQYTTFTAQDASIAFGVTPNVEISADEYAYISADAFRLMLQNSSRSITVVDGAGNSKIRFDSDSTNLPQDIFIGNFKTTGTGSSVATLSGFSSTTSAKIKVAVGSAFTEAVSGKTICLYDTNGNKLDVEVTLQGDNTVNFFAPLSSYTIAADDWSGQNTNTDTTDDGSKENPSMGGGF